MESSDELRQEPGGSIPTAGKPDHVDLWITERIGELVEADIVAASEIAAPLASSALSALGDVPSSGFKATDTLVEVSPTWRIDRPAGVDDTDSGSGWESRRLVLHSLLCCRRHQSLTQYWS